MTNPHKSWMLVCAGLAVVSVLVDVTAQPQDVSFIAHRDFDVGALPQSVAVGDFNGDGVQDLAVANYRSSTVSVLLSNGDGSFQAARNLSTGSSPTSIAVGD